MWVQFLVKELRSHVPGAQYRQSKVRAGQRTETTPLPVWDQALISQQLWRKVILAMGRAAEGVPGVFR